MKKTYLFFFAIAILFSLANVSCKQKGTKNSDDPLRGIINQRSNVPFDKTLIAPFYRSYPELKKYEKDVVSIYKRYKYNHIWFDNQGIVEFGNSLYSKVKDLDEEGISSAFPYQEKIEGIFNNEKGDKLNDTETELMLTNLYVFYAKKVYKGIDDTTTTSIGWLIPRKQVSYGSLVDSLVSDQKLKPEGNKILFQQYYKLRSVLQHYREIEKKGSWNPVFLDPRRKIYKPGDTALAIQQIRAHLFISGDIAQDNNSNKYDAELVAAIRKYQLRNGDKPHTLITTRQINELNVPIGDLIKKIVVNMERCRWISPEIYNSKEFIVVNIPSYQLNLLRDGRVVFESPVVVGNSMNKTVIFGGKLSYIVFSPYWRLPKSIIDDEVKPGMAKHKNYLASQHMEWNNGQVRQKPGKYNSLGLIKFMFPNSNDIYFHDSPAKYLFAKESRAFSHGCVRVGKARDLAVTILQEDENWTPQKIDAAMHTGKETQYGLKQKIPVYIGYFTAWVDEKGEINFYDDIYERDESLAKLLID